MLFLWELSNFHSIQQKGIKILEKLSDSINGTYLNPVVKELNIANVQKNRPNITL